VRVAAHREDRRPGLRSVDGDFHVEAVHARLRRVALPEAKRVGGTGEPDGLAHEPRVLRRRVRVDGTRLSETPRPRAARRVVDTRLAMPLIDAVAAERY